MNNKILSTKKTISLFLAFILVTGTIALSFPSSMRDVQAQQGYDGTYNNYENDYGKDNSYKSIDNKIVKKVKCNNINVNVNGLELTTLPSSLDALLTDGQAGDEGQYGASSYGSGEGSYGSGGQSGSDKDFKFVCINNNNNTVVGEEPIPSTTASLTVKKQVFGCDNFDSIDMDCDFQNNSEEWLDCNNSPISGTIFCQSLPESIFDIEVLDDQNAQIQQFEGSEQGTAIQNLEPGTYTVNEMKQDGNLDTLGILESAEEFCVNEAGFSDGGDLFNTASSKYYNPICFEYEDEQGNDCSTIALAAGEERTCTVKNYIVKALGN